MKAKLLSIHEIEKMLSSIYFFKGLTVHNVEALTEGKNNQNFKVCTDSGDFFLKKCHTSAAQGIDRQIEYTILDAVYREGLGVKPILFDPNINVIVNAFEDFPVWTVEEIKKIAALKCFGEAIAKMHTLLPVKRKNYIGDLLDRYWLSLEENDQVKKLEPFFKKTQKQLHTYHHPDDMRFCHNDLYYGNFLKSETILFIDWENAGINDLYSELATFLHLHPLDETQANLFLDAYSQIPLDRNKLKAHQDAILLRELLWVITKLQEGYTDFFYVDYQQRCLKAVADKTNNK